MDSQIRVLPTEWTGTIWTSSWGVVTPHHPNFHSHKNREDEWHTIENNTVKFTVLRQSGPFLDMTFSATDHESKAVGVLSPDGLRLEIATLEVTFHLHVDGDRIWGEGEARAHGMSDRRGSFAVKMVELTATSPTA